MPDVASPPGSRISRGEVARDQVGVDREAQNPQTLREVVLPHRLGCLPRWSRVARTPNAALGCFVPCS